jgi:hypothetical protein
MRGEDLERERQRTLDRLAAAFANEAISDEEFQRRARLAQEARDEGDLALVCADLATEGDARLSSSVVKGTRAEPVPADYARFSPPATVNRSGLTLAFFDDRRYTGNWLTAKGARGATLLGDIVYDLRECDFSFGVGSLEVFAILGDVRVIVPRGLPVRTRVSRLLGDAVIDPDLSSDLRPGEPGLDLRIFSLLGDVKVVVD